MTYVKRGGNGPCALLDVNGVIMAATQTDDIPRNRRKMSPLTLVIVGLIGVCLYFASIGPLAGLEACGHGTPAVWRSLKPAYYPVFWSWKHGPDWWADGVRKYTQLFHRPTAIQFPPIYQFASCNDADVHCHGRWFRQRFVCPSHNPSPKAWYEYLGGQR